MDSTGYAIVVVNLILGLGLGWPLARVFARLGAGVGVVSAGGPAGVPVDKPGGRPAGVPRLYAGVVAAYLAECVAFSASMGTGIVSVFMAVVWGVVLGRRLRAVAAAPAEIAKAVRFFAGFTSLPAVSFLVVPVAAGLGGWSVTSAESGRRFGIPAFLPPPLDTILGFSLAVAAVTTILKMFITTSVTSRVLRRAAIAA